MSETENVNEQGMSEITTPKSPAEGKGSSGRFYFRLLWLVAFVAVAVVLIVRHFDKAANILLAVIGLGLMIIVHEFGHFIVAKLNDIHVEAFSIGFPPVLFGIRRSEEGYRMRILPEVFPSERKEAELTDEEADEWDEGRFHFTFGKKGRSGETEYRIGLIPFGGFVKMLGQEDIGQIKQSDDPRSYANKSVWRRASVISAGVGFNVLSAIVIFMVVFLVGIQLPPPIVGGVYSGSPADKAGLVAGDEIIEVNGKRENLEFSDIGMAAALSLEGEEVAVTVRHEDGSVEESALVARKIPELAKNMKVFGILQPVSLTVEEVTESKALYEKTGLKPGDRITSVNGKAVDNLWELKGALRNVYTDQVPVRAERKGNGDAQVVDTVLGLQYLPVAGRDKTGYLLSHIYSMVPRLKVGSIGEAKGRKDRALNLKEEDIIVEIGDVKDPNFVEMREVTQAHNEQELQLKVFRRDEAGDMEQVTVTVVPKAVRRGGDALIGFTPILEMEQAVVAETIETEGIGGLEIPEGARITAVDGTAVKSFYDVIEEIRKHPNERISIDYRLSDEVAGSVALETGDFGDFIRLEKTVSEEIPFKAMTELYKASGPIDAIGMGFKKTVQFVVQTYLTLRSVVLTDIGADNLRGPIGIIEISYTVISRASLSYYLYLLGLISACISVVNFLPMLPFDGGHVLFLVIEKIKGSPVHERVQTSIATVGWVFVGALIIYLTYHDIVRLVTGVF